MADVPLPSLGSAGVGSAELREVLVQQVVEVGVSRLLKQRPDRRHPPTLPLLYTTCITRELARTQKNTPGRPIESPGVAADRREGRGGAAERRETKG